MVFCVRMSDKMKFVLLVLVFYLQNSSAVGPDVYNKIYDGLNALGDTGISTDCRTVMDLYREDLGKDTSWAYKMIDASTKLPVGVASGNYGELGQFKQCLSAKSVDGRIKPKFCLGKVALNFDQPDKLRFKSRGRIAKLSHVHEVKHLLPSVIQLAICLPIECTDDDIEKLYKDILLPLSLQCQTEEDVYPPLTAGAIGTIVVLALFGLLMIVSTSLDLFSKLTGKEPFHAVFTSFSVYTNGKKLFRINENPNEVRCLNGIRFWSMIWVIIGHVFYVVISFQINNFKDVLKWTDTARSLVILNAGLSVDTFLLMSGAIIVYNFFKVRQNGKEFNISYFLYFYVHRYLRLTPALAVAVLVTANLLDYMGAGPDWGEMLNSERHCRRYWWTTLLYIQNYVNGKEVCISPSWYLSIDMQLYIISPLVLLLLWKFPKIGVAVVIVCILGFIVGAFCIGYLKQLSAFPYDVHNLNTVMKWDAYNDYYYAKTHARAAPWFIGLLLGYILAEIKFNGLQIPSISMVMWVLLWFACLATNLACVFGGYATLLTEDYKRLGNSFHIALVRPVWAFCLLFLVVACFSGYGGPINWFLSIPAYQMLNRFSYSIYLVHYPVLMVIVYSSKWGTYFDELHMAFFFWGILLVSFILSILWVLAFEAPFVNLEKLIFRIKEEDGEAAKEVTSS